MLGDHTVVSVDTEGKKQLGLREGHTEHSRVAKALLRDLVDRGLDPDRARLFVIDGRRRSPRPSARCAARSRHPALSAPQTAQHSGRASARACDRGFVEYADLVQHLEGNPQNFNQLACPVVGEPGSEVRRVHGWRDITLDLLQRRNANSRFALGEPLR